MGPVRLAGLVGPSPPAVPAVPTAPAVHAAPAASAGSEWRSWAGSSEWRGWAGSAAATGSVTVGAVPLVSGASGSRILLRTRSWFALESPMELLSPLSVLRILFGIGLVLWPLLGVAWRWDGVGGATVAAAGTAAVAVWIALLSVRTVSAGWCKALAGIWVVDISMLVWAAHGTRTAFGFVTLYGFMGAFVALFFAARVVIAYVLGTATGLWLAMFGTQGAGVATVVALLGAVSTAMVSGTVFLLARSTRRHRTVDPETSLANAFGLASRLSGWDADSPLVVALVLVEGIDEAREALGHQVGSQLLCRVIENLVRVLPAGTVIGRGEGDALVVVEAERARRSEGPARPDRPARSREPDGGRGRAGQAALVSARLLGEVVRSGPYLVEGVEVALQSFTGLAVGPWAGTEVSELIRRATLSARRAAATGQPQLVWDGDSDAMTAEDLALLAALGNAAQRGQLSLVYQPQVDSRSGRTVSVEALLRWSSPEHGAVPPSRFIVLAERTGLIDRLTGWILTEALDAQVRWLRADRQVPVSVNFSARTLTRPDLAEWILAELRLRDLSPTCLTVEVTETAAADLPQAVRRLARLRDQGVRVSIDDFGTGHTSLEALPSLPVDELKIDRSFVHRSATSPADDAIVRTFRELAHRLGLVAVAEGVEDEVTRLRLVGLGFDLLQGYHLARPLAEPELLTFVGDEPALATEVARRGSLRSSG